MKTKVSKKSITVLKMATIKQSFLSKEVLKLLTEREMYIDSIDRTHSQIYDGSVFEAILGEYYENNSGLKLNIKTVEELEKWNNAMMDDEIVYVEIVNN